MNKLNKRAYLASAVIIGLISFAIAWKTIFKKPFDYNYADAVPTRVNCSAADLSPFLSHSIPRFAKDELVVHVTVVRTVDLGPSRTIHAPSQGFVIINEVINGQNVPPGEFKIQTLDDRCPMPLSVGDSGYLVGSVIRWKEFNQIVKRYPK